MPHPTDEALDDNAEEADKPDESSDVDEEMEDLNSGDRSSANVATEEESKDYNDDEGESDGSDKEESSGEEKVDELTLKLKGLENGDFIPLSKEGGGEPRGCGSGRGQVNPVIKDIDGFKVVTVSGDNSANGDIGENKLPGELELNIDGEKSFKMVEGGSVVKSIDVAKGNVRLFNDKMKAA